MYMNFLYKNPFLNSLLAEGYIVFVACVIHFFGKQNSPDTFFDSITALSLFVLSAAVMGSLFLGGPILLYLDGQKKRAATYFIQTVLGFAIITCGAIVLIKVMR
jgi:predicted permease